MKEGKEKRETERDGERTREGGTCGVSFALVPIMDTNSPWGYCNLGGRVKCVVITITCGAQEERQLDETERERGGRARSASRYTHTHTHTRSKERGVRK